MAGFLPNELILEIFSRLPVKSVVRFRCVSKMWYNLISSPHFIATHLTRSLSNPQHEPFLLFHRFDSGLRKARFTLHSSHDPFPQNHFTKHLDFSNPAIHILLLSLDREIEAQGGFFAYPSDFTELRCSHQRNSQISMVVGSSNGLVCLADVASGDGLLSYVLWNPSIHKSISLPNPTISMKSHGQLVESVGFGYDAKTDDYKLVRLVYLTGGVGIGFHNVPTLVEIYTLKTGAWHSVTVPALSYIVEMWSLSAFLNGAVHWLANTSRQQGLIRNLIASFDVKDEAFHEVAVPKSLQGHPLNMAISVLDGSLALVPCNQWVGDECHSVWVMKEYGVAESWAKLFDIDVGGGLGRVIGFGYNGEVLVTKDGRMVSYEPSSQRRKDLHIWGPTDSFYLDTYVESLVLLNVANQIQEWDETECDTN